MGLISTLGKIIRLKDYDRPEKGPCGKGLHASRNPNDCFIGAKIPCRAFRVKGIDKIAGDNQKSRYQALKVIEEVHDLDALFGWNYTEACNPINPFQIKPPVITETHIQWLREWASVRDSVRASVWASVWDSVRAYVRASVRASVGAYVGSLFPGIKKWKYVKHEVGVYPFQSAVNLWRVGLVPFTDGKIWQLHGGPKVSILWKGKL